MLSMAEPAPDYQVHYLTAGRYVAWFLIGVGAVGLVSVFASGQLGSSWPVLLVTAAVWLFAYVLGLRPAVLEEIGGVSVRNPLRTTYVPWAGVASVDVTDVLRVHTADSVVRCFAVPRRRPHVDRMRATARDYGFPGMDQSAGPVGPPVARAEVVAGRLRTQAEKAAKAGLVGGPVAVRVAPAAVACLAVAVLLVVLAVVVA
jgi:Bacterial PH domain